MDPLGPKDTARLQAAYGFLGQGNHESAALELDGIDPQSGNHPGVLSARLSLAHASKQWEKCLELVERLIAAQPGNPVFWVHRATFMCELGRAQEAWDQLLPATERFPKFWMVPYTLAGIACLSGNHEEAIRHLQLACTLADPQFIKAKALEERDLQPIRSRMIEACG